MGGLASMGSSTMLWPPMVTSPSVGGMKPVIMRMVVLLPAPFGPRKPNTSPFSTVKETPLTATFGPKDFFKFRTFIMKWGRENAANFRRGDRMTALPLDSLEDFQVGTRTF